MTADVNCVFCRIIAGDEPGFVVFQDEVAMGFLDRTPLFAGHTLVVPIEHHVTLPELPVDQVAPLFQRARQLAGLMPEVLGAQGTFVAMNNIVSQSVPHLHVHVVPRTKGDGLKGFFWPRTRYESEEHAASVAAQLAEAWDALGPIDS